MRRWRPGAVVGLAAAAALSVTAANLTGDVAAASTSSTTTPGVTLTTERSPAGPIIVTGRGYTLYDYAPDTRDHSHCITDLCVTLWPPLVVQGQPTVGKGLSARLVGTTRRSNGTLQVTYGGHPLYTWKGDTKPGMVTGQALLNAGGYWYVVSPSGKQIKTQFTVGRPSLP